MYPFLQTFKFKLIKLTKKPEKLLAKKYLQESVRPEVTLKEKKSQEIAKEISLYDIFILLMLSFNLLKNDNFL